jgi:Mitochondrial ribosomal protein (VAR1)
MKTKNSMIYFNDLIQNSTLKNRTNSDQSVFDLNSNQNLRKYIESLNMIEYRNIRSLFDNYNHQFFVNEKRIPKNLFIFLEYSFLSLFYLISKPFLEITPDKIVFILFCFQLKQKEKIISYNEYESLNKNKEIIYSENIADRSISEINRIKFKIISLILRKLFKKTVELEIIRLHYPYYETNIFINLLNKTINKIKIKRVLSKIFETANILDPNKLLDKKINKIPSFISGIKIRIAGRLLTQRIVPRKTVKTISKGSLAKSNTIHLEKGRITNKNKRGAFSVTITLGHIRIS